MGKNNTGFFYGKLYNSCNRTFLVGNGEKFIGGTGQCQCCPTFFESDVKSIEGHDHWVCTRKIGVLIISRYPETN